MATKSQKAHEEILANGTPQARKWLKSYLEKRYGPKPLLPQIDSPPAPARPPAGPPQADQDLKEQCEAFIAQQKQDPASLVHRPLSRQEQAGKDLVEHIQHPRELEGEVFADDKFFEDRSDLEPKREPGMEG